METILLTGGAGFIGSHLAENLLRSGRFKIVCIDSLDDFYSPTLKQENLTPLIHNPNFTFIKEDIANLTTDKAKMLLADHHFHQIVNLAARAGVRPSIQDPLKYYRTNVIGLLNLLEFARISGIRRFVSASSSSVYGNNPNVPWSESETNLKPISPYASSKLAAEHLGQVYAHLYGIRFTVVRPFTVFGPRQRPDLAIRKFIELILLDREVLLFGDGTTRRDYTYVGDIVEGIELAMKYEGDSLFDVFNLGNSQPITLNQMIATIEEVMDKKAKLKYIGDQPGDVNQTFANISKAKDILGYHPKTTFKDGLRSFLEWEMHNRVES